jgi:hypothetical protein
MQVEFMRRPGPYAAVVAALACGAVTDAHGEPFLVRNQHPVVALYGLPSPLPARLPATQATRIAGVINWSNFATTETQDDVHLTLDGEAFEVRAHVDHSFAGRFALHAELAYRNLSEGSLDGLVDSWHQVFGLPNGSRSRLPEDQLLLEYRTGEISALYISENSGGFADMPVAAGYQLLAADSSAVATWLSVKVPTGKAADFTGSGAIDVALSIAAEHHLAEQWQLFGQANVAWLGDGDLLPDEQESYAWSALAGVTWNAWRTLDLTIQFEANSAVLSTGLEELDGDAVILTFGGSYRTAGAWQFDLGVSEDIEVGASPDVVFSFAVRRLL